MEPMRDETREPRRHGDTEKINLICGNITEGIIGSAIEVHKELGPGLLESIYETCLCHELNARGLSFERQVAVPVVYKGITIEGIHRVDLIVEKNVIVELKSVDRTVPIHEAQLLTYLRLTGIRVGLLINFNEAVIKNGIRRLIL